MASNGLLNYAKMGRCRICFRVRKTREQVIPVGEVCHGYATGHIWECINKEECDLIAKERIVNRPPKAELIKINLLIGRYRK